MNQILGIMVCTDDNDKIEAFCLVVEDGSRACVRSVDGSELIVEIIPAEDSE